MGCSSTLTSLFVPESVLGRRARARCERPHTARSKCKPPRSPTWS